MNLVPLAGYYTEWVIRIPMTNGECVKSFCLDKKFEAFPGLEPTTPRTWHKRFTTVLPNRLSIRIVYFCIVYLGIVLCISLSKTSKLQLGCLHSIWTCHESLTGLHPTHFDRSEFLVYTDCLKYLPLFFPGGTFVTKATAFTRYRKIDTVINPWYLSSNCYVKVFISFKGDRLDWLEGEKRAAMVTLAFGGKCEPEG